jgi:uncharacterized protein YdaU (DUF1376 family)
VGDYLRDTSRLSMLDHGAYNLLLDYYYAEEHPISLELDEVYRMVRAQMPEERRAVVKILSKFFTKAEDGYRHKRVDHEIAVSRKARDNGERGGRPRTGVVTGSETETETEIQTGTTTGTNTVDITGSGHPPTTNHHPPTASLPTTKKHTGRKRPSVCLPAGFAVSDRVKAWAAQKGYTRIEAHHEHFVGVAKAKGYVYVDWDEALMNAIRDDWAKLRTNGAPVDVDEMVRELEEKNAAH